mmetsp:Transcript_28480/g.48400  ORF Transcript_28480/g.48400 Transcript_28480/m.48400 type:complete len:222 (-) Transcript_28480:1098-1763(-)
MFIYLYYQGNVRDMSCLHYFLNRPIDKENPAFSFDFTQPPDVWVHPKSLVASESVSLRCLVVEVRFDDAEGCSCEESCMRFVLGVLFLLVKDAEELSESEALLADDEYDEEGFLASGVLFRNSGRCLDGPLVVEHEEAVYDGAFFSFLGLITSNELSLLTLLSDDRYSFRLACFVEVTPVLSFGAFFGDKWTLSSDDIERSSTPDACVFFLTSSCLFSCLS